MQDRMDWLLARRQSAGVGTTGEEMPITKKLQDRIRLTGWVLNIILVFSAIIAIWLASFQLARTSWIATVPLFDRPFDLASVLFASAQISMFAITILIGFLTIVGWGAVENKIRETVERVTAERLATVENEARGRSFAIQGYMIGEASIDPKDASKPENEERLREAIYYCEQAYKFLKGTGLPVEFMTLNNLLYYVCAVQDKTRRHFYLDLARQLRSEAEAHGSFNLVLTYCRTILVFSEDPKEKEEACSLLRNIKASKSLNEKQQREVRYLTSLCSEYRAKSARGC